MSATRARRALGHRVLVASISAVLLVALPGALASAGAANRAVSGAVVTADVHASLSISTLPANLTPSVKNASTDTALIDTPSLSNCNYVVKLIVVSKCVFGDRTGTHTMFLWGDSHAFMWFPALNAVAKAAHWRLVALMAFGCPVAYVSVWNTLTHTKYTSCDDFRAEVIKIINRQKPSLVVVAEAFTSYAASGKGVAGTISLAQWKAGLEKSLKLVHAKNMKKVVLSSTVTGGSLSPPECLAANPTSVQSCTVTDSPGQLAQRSTEAAAAKAEKASYVNTLPWLCSTAVTPLACSPVIGDPTDGYMVVYYAAGHLTETYDLFLQGVLGTALKPSMK